MKKIFNRKITAPFVPSVEQPDEPFQKLNVKTILHYGGSCPFQLEGLSEFDEEVYVRYRSGHLSVDVGRKRFFDEYVGENETDESLMEGLRRLYKDDNEQIQKNFESYKLMREYSGGYLCFDGSMTTEELVEITKNYINWPESF